jgi:hypothetical protein
MLKKKIFHCAVFITLTILNANPAFAASPVQTEHFRIMSFGGSVPHEKLKRIGQDLESAYADILTFLGVDPYKSGKIDVSVHLKPRAGRNLRASAGAAHIDLDADFNDIKLLRHELAHIVIHKPLPSAPRWFHEGLAQYIGSGDIRLSNRDSSPPLKNFSFTRLEADFGAGKSEGDAYYYAWSIVSYLMDVYGKEKLKQVFKESGFFKDKFANAYGAGLKDVEQKADYIFDKYRPCAR